MAPDAPKALSSFAMSTVFGMRTDFGDGQPDVVLLSQDAVHFFLRRARLLAVSSSQFDYFLHPYLNASFSTLRPSMPLTEDSWTLNVVFHIIYGISFRIFSPPLETLLKAVRSLQKYGIPPNSHVIPGTPIFDDIVLRMPQQPLEVYILAAENDIFELARIASGYLLNLEVHSLPRAATLRISPAYLSLLYNLHMLRKRVLHELILLPPDEHEPTYLCGYGEYQALVREWIYVTSPFLLDGKAGL